MPQPAEITQFIFGQPLREDEDRSILSILYGDLATLTMRDLFPAVRGSHVPGCLASPGFRPKLAYAPAAAPRSPPSRIAADLACGRAFMKGVERNGVGNEFMVGLPNKSTAQRL